MFLKGTDRECVGKKFFTISGQHQMDLSPGMAYFITMLQSETVFGSILVLDFYHISNSYMKWCMEKQPPRMELPFAKKYWA